MRATVRLKHVHTDKDRHGNVRVYYQSGRGAPKIRLKSPIGSAAFMQEYNEARLKGAQPVHHKGSFPPGTFGALLTAYYASPEFAALRSSTQAVRRRILDKLKETHGHKRVAHMEPRHVRTLRNEKAKTPHAANVRLKILKALFKWAVEVQIMETNPANEIQRLKAPTEGHHTWTDAERAAFRERHPSGTKARLAYALLFYTLARKSDAVTFGRQMIQDGSLRYRCKKTDRWVTTQLARQVWREIDQLPADQMTFLLTKSGKPFTVNGFGNWFRDRCDEAGLTECSAHGLRKAGATFAANHGATASHLQGLGDWSDLTEPSRYTRAVERKKMASIGVKILEQSEDD